MTHCSNKTQMIIHLYILVNHVLHRAWIAKESTLTHVQVRMCWEEIAMMTKMNSIKTITSPNFLIIHWVKLFSKSNSAVTWIMVKCLISKMTTLIILHLRLILHSLIYIFHIHLMYKSLSLNVIKVKCINLIAMTNSC